MLNEIETICAQLKKIVTATAPIRNKYIDIGYTFVWPNFYYKYEIACYK